MARSAKPRKPKVSLMQRRQAHERRVVESHIANMVLTHWDSKRDDQGEKTYTSNVPWEVVDVAARTKREWYFEAVIKSLDVHGKVFYDQAYITTPAILINDLADFYPELLEKAYDGVNRNLVIDTGWQARPLTPQLRMQLRWEEALAS